jgi:Glycine rich protein
MAHLRIAALFVAAAACGKVEVAPPDAAPVTLTVAVTGDGHVTSTPAGIDCPGSCTHGFDPGTQVALTQTGLHGESFSGWSGDTCTGTADCSLTLSAEATVTAAFACTGMVTFEFADHPQVFIRPACTTTFTVDARGGAGGHGFGNGVSNGSAALGGRVQATMTFQPNDVVYVFVGGVGADATSTAVGPGGFNGGGPGGTCCASQYGGGGGGASDIRVNGLLPANRVLVAGGAGGVATCSGNPVAAGAGGGLIGADSVPCAPGTDTPAKGGTQTAGGAGGAYPSYPAGTAGTIGDGGTGGGGTGGGGGGGGYFGGGGGGWNGGAGGSSFAAAAITDAVHTQGFQMGAGQVIFSY